MSALQLFDALPSHIEDALRASIRRFGVLVPVVKDQHGRIVDGHHRSRIAGELGVDFAVQVVTVADEDEAREIARTLNSDRRQLTEEQRRAVVAELREHGHSVRAIAGALGVGKSTVDRDLSGLSRAGQLVEPERVMRQGGGSYPSARSAVVEPEPACEPDAIDDIPLPFDEPQPEGVHTVDTPAVPVLTPEQQQAATEFRAAVQASAERQQQEVMELIAEQRARNAFDEACRALLSALSWAAAFKPPADTESKAQTFIAHAKRLTEITETWEQPA